MVDSACAASAIFRSTILSVEVCVTSNSVMTVVTNKRLLRRRIWGRMRGLSPRFISLRGPFCGKCAWRAGLLSAATKTHRTEVSGGKPQKTARFFTREAKPVLPLRITPSAGERWSMKNSKSALLRCLFPAPFSWEGTPHRAQRLQYCGT